jgi:hypothetical protein
MKPRLLVCAGTLAALSAAGQTAPAAKPAAAAAVKPATKAYIPPKTAWGDPDLQGQWPATANIPMQRPANLGTRAYLTEEEFQAREKQAQKQSESDSEEFAPASGATNVTINPPSYWVEHGAPSHQASLVIDPPNGRTPALTPAGQQAVKALNDGRGPGQHFPEKVDNWTDFDIYSRCITRGMLSSMLPTLYNFGNQIVQMPGYVAIRNEMIHETRVIPLNGGPHVGSAIKTYMGDSRGHWDGNTLVVETTNLKDQPGAAGGLFSDAAKVTERFTRTSPTDLVYQATIDDPKTWTKPWTLSMPYKLDPHYTIYEYACHEGNYMMLDSLSGARELEKKGLSTKVDRGNAGGPLPAQQ